MESNTTVQLGDNFSVNVTTDGINIKIDTHKGGNSIMSDHLKRVMTKFSLLSNEHFVDKLKDVYKNAYRGCFV